MMAETVPQQEYTRARRAVDEFVAHFDESYRLLAYHAALPLVLTPELLNYLRNQFLRGQVPWVAEVDLLLSDLCSPAGNELYAMDPAVRAYLLSEMRQHSELGPTRMAQVAHLLIHYVQHLARTDPFLGKHELQAQQWAAMVYLDDKRETAVKEITEAFRNCSLAETASVQMSSSLIDQAEMLRLSRLTQTLAPGLEAYPELVEYAQNVSWLLSNPTDVGKLQDREHWRNGAQVLGVQLPSLEELTETEVSDSAAKIETVTTRLPFINREDELFLILSTFAPAYHLA